MPHVNITGASLDTHKLSIPTKPLSVPRMQQSCISVRPYHQSFFPLFSPLLPSSLPRTLSSSPSLSPLSVSPLPQSLYTERVPEDFPAGRLILQVSATDADIRSNAHISYELQGPGAELFTIDPDTGVCVCWSVCFCLCYTSTHSVC